MIEENDIRGNITPIGFYYKDNDGEVKYIKIDKAKKCGPSADIISGAVGDKYECRINGNLEYLYYGKLVPRKWFRIENVTEAEYNAYYKMPKRTQQES